MSEISFLRATDSAVNRVHTNKQTKNQTLINLFDFGFLLCWATFFIFFFFVSRTRCSCFFCESLEFSVIFSHSPLPPYTYTTIKYINRHNSKSLSPAVRCGGRVDVGAYRTINSFTIKYDDKFKCCASKNPEITSTTEMSENLYNESDVRKLNGTATFGKITKVWRFV